MRMLLYSFVFLYALIAQAQEPLTTILVQKDSLAVDLFVGIDNFDALYTIKDHTLFKKTATEEWSYKNLQLGKLSSVDILNPLKITLFYEDFNTVVILDNTLSEIQQIDFNTVTEFKNLLSATTANDRNLWIFDTNTQQLEVYNYVLGKTPVQNQPISEEIIALRSNYNYCRVLSETMLYTYNVYGSLLSEFPMNNVTTFSMTNTEVLFLKKTALFYLKNKTIQPIKLPSDKIAIKQFSLHEDILYIYDGIFLYAFQLKKPKTK